MPIPRIFNFRSSGADPAIVTHDEMVKICASGECAVIDVREPHEFRLGHIQGSLNVPLSSFRPSQVPTDRPVVLVCLSGARSAGALRMLKASGHEKVRHYKAGVTGWRLQGGKLV